MEPEAGIIDGLMTLELPPGVDPEISVIEARAQAAARTPEQAGVCST